MAALEAARRREEGYRAKVAALAAECEAVARDRRRAAAKLARARAELEAVKGEGGAAAGGGDASGAGASATPPRPWPPSPGGRLGPDSGDWAADDDPAAAATTTITTRSLALAFSALAVCAAWWARAGPPYPALSHKAILAAAGPWALTLLSSRARSPLARVWLLGGAWAMVGFVVAHWLVMPDGVMVG